MSYQCRNCESTTTPIIRSRVSTFGWVWFWLLVWVGILPGLVGLLFRSDIRVCPNCGKKNP